MDVEASKRNAGRRAADLLVAPGMRLGLGTGTTAIHALRRVAERYAAGELPGLLVVATSTQTEFACWQHGLPLVSLNDARINATLDLALDGADQVGPDHNLIKGGGGALLTEKIVARAARRYAIVVDTAKLAERLGLDCAVPLEVARESVALVRREVADLSGVATLREGPGKAGPVVTDHGNFILDVHFQERFDPADMERQLNLIPGVLESGIFTTTVHDLLVGDADDQVRHLSQE